MYQEVYSRKVPGSRLYFSIQYDPESPSAYCWCEQYGGGGHYFQTMPETVDYCRSRKWITKAQAESIIAELKAKSY